MNNAEREVLRETAILAAHAAGAIQRRRFRSKLHIDETLQHDLKLEIDRACEDAIIECIRSRHPGHAVISEESGTAHGSAAYCWVLDPLDGTVNYFNGLPLFCVSVACYTLPTQESVGAATERSYRLGEGLVGVVYAAALDELYVGMRGAGVFRNDRQLAYLSPACLEDSVIGISQGSSDAAMSRMLGITGRLARRARKLRCLGATALEMAYVAAGHLGGIVQQGPRIWDMAAGRLFIEEVGGSVEAVEYEPGRFDLVACAPGLLTELRRAREPDG